MSSSDSDDDCYGNVAKKLQTLKSAYVPEKIEVNLSDNKKEKNVENTSTVVIEDVNTSFNTTDNEELTLDAIIAKNPVSKRGRKRKSADNSFEPIYERVTRSSKRKTINSTKGRKNNATTDNVEALEATDNVQSTDNSTTVEESVLEPSLRGRRGKNVTRTVTNTSNTGRGASRGNSRGTTPRRGNARGNRGRSRGRNSRNNFILSNYPIFSIGNTDEYPDMCDNQELFSNRKEVVIVEDIDPLDTDNEELSVKVFWQNIEVVRFNLRKYQKLTPIFKYFSDKEKIGFDKLLFMYGDKILKRDDTPESINYNIAKFIDGGIVNQDISGLVKQDTDGDGLKLKFQCQNVKKPIEVMLRPEEKFASAMMKCAEHIEVPLERLKFYFDGDLLSSKSTPIELEFEGGECIDVKISS